jgi:hypothetical protein
MITKGREVRTCAAGSTASTARLRQRNTTEGWPATQARARPHGPCSGLCCHVVEPTCGRRSHSARPASPRAAAPPSSAGPGARKVSGTQVGPKDASWPICAFLCEYSYKRLELAQLLGQHGGCLTWLPMMLPRPSTVGAAVQPDEGAPKFTPRAEIPCASPRIL